MSFTFCWLLKPPLLGVMQITAVCIASNRAHSLLNGKKCTLMFQGHSVVFLCREESQIGTACVFYEDYWEVEAAGHVGEGVDRGTFRQSSSSGVLCSSAA